MKGDVKKIKIVCPEYQECLDNHIEEFEYSDFENAEFDLISNTCCGCIRCILLRHKIGCGDDCYMRKTYPQYQDDRLMFQLATGVDEDEVIEFLEEEYEYDPFNARPINNDTIAEEIINRIALSQKRLRDALGEERIKEIFKDEE